MVESLYILEQLTKLLADLIDAEARRDVPLEMRWALDAHTLALKLFSHAASVSVLVRGTSFTSSNNQKLDMFDYASSNAIARAAMENHLVFSYIFNAKDLKGSEFRHLTWRIGGLMDRQQYKSHLIKNNMQLKSERQTADELIERMKTDPHFLAMNKSQQDKLVKGNWRMGLQWKDLASLAGLDALYFNNIYKHLCGYSHSGYISTVQIRDSWNSIKDQKEMARTVAVVTSNVLSYFAVKYCEFFPNAQQVLDARSELKSLVETWAVKAKHWEEVRLAQQGQ